MKPYYQEIVNLRQENDSRVLRFLEEAARALEQSSKVRAKSSIKALIEIKHEVLPDNVDRVIVNSISNAFFFNLMSRLVFIGLLESFWLLVDWWCKQTDKYFTSKWACRRYAWAAIVEIELSGSYRSKASSLDTQFKTHIRTLIGVLREIAAFRVLSAAELREVFGVLPTSAQQPINHTTQLFSLVEKLLTGLQIIIQIWLERALTQITRGKGQERLQSLKKRHNHLRSTLKKYNTVTGVLDESIATTKIINRLHRGRYLDALLSGSAMRRRSIEYTHYNSEGDEDAEGRHTLVRYMLRQRDEQIAYIEYMFGFALDARGNLIPESVELSGWMKKVGTHYTIHDNDSWVRILTVLFQEYVKKYVKTAKAAGHSSNAAFIAFKDSLRHYFRYIEVFTEHSKYNIRDNFDIRDDRKNYLNTVFPRTLTGRYIHDCGVYAIRNSYIIQRFSQKIDRQSAASESLPMPTFDFVRLPLHVGLMIKHSSGSALITHNKDTWFFDSEQLADLEDEWTKTDTDGNTISGSPIPLDKTIFMAELAAALFIAYVDQPAIVIPIPKPAPSPVRTRKQLWHHYLSKIVMPKRQLFSHRVTRPKDHTYQFPMRYVELTELKRAWYNESVVREFWNKTAFNAWQTHKTALGELFSMHKSASDENREDAFHKYDEERNHYLIKVNDGLEKVIESEKPLKKKSEELNSAIELYPYVFEKHVIRTYHRRLGGNVLSSADLGRVQDHQNEMSQHPDDADALERKLEKAERNLRVLDREGAARPEDRDFVSGLRTQTEEAIRLRDLKELPVPPFATESDLLVPIPE